MHIGIVSEAGNFHTQKWAEALEQQGAKVTVFSFEQFSSGWPRHIGIVPEYKKSGLPFFFSYLFSGRALAKALKEQKIDILHPLNISPFGIWAMKSNFKPLIPFAFGADILEFPNFFKADAQLAQRHWNQDKAIPNSKWRYALRRIFFRYWIGKTLFSSNHILADNQSLIQALEDWFHVPPNKISLIRTGIETHWFDPDLACQEKLKAKFKIQENQTVVLSPRGAKLIYQADIILKGMALLLKKHGKKVNCIFLTAGYSVPPFIQEQAEQLAREFESFTFLKETLNRNEMAQLWNLTQLFISAPIYDGYSSSVAEGRFAGALPIVNDSPATREWAKNGENAVLVHPFTAENLFLRLDEDLPNSSLRAKAAELNRNWVLENGLLEPNAKKFLKICEIHLNKAKY